MKVTRYAEIRIDPCKTKPCKYIVEDFRPRENPNITMKLTAFNFLTETTGGSSDRKVKLTMYDYGVSITSASLHGGSGLNEGNCTGKS